MPYRRLPNTDAARLKALDNAMNVSMKISPNELAYTQKTHQLLKFFLPSYKQSLNLLKETYQNQVEKSKIHQQLQKNAKLYVSHFIQVLNLAIVRGEISESVRELYGLQDYQSKLPSINADADVIFWGKKIIEGESQRIAQGGTPIMNPRIAIVKIKYEQFVEAGNNHKFTNNSYNRVHDKIIEMRPEANSIILNIWNEVEDYFKDLPSEEKRLKAKEYGVVYVHRPFEVVKY